LKLNIFVLSVLFLAGIVCGVNWGRLIYNFENVWPEERQGLHRLNQLMEPDKTDRLAMITITAKQQYIISALGDQYTVQVRIVEKP